jgi:hypothetical protein
MRTRAKSGFRKPVHRLNLSDTPTLTPLPKTYKISLLDRNWATTMNNEYQALLANDTWQLVPRPSNTNVVFDKRVCHQKFHSNGS